MSDSSSQFESVPENLLLSGDGLRQMKLEQYQLLLRMLGGIGIDARPVTIEDFISTDAAFLAPEQTPKDLPIYKSDFHQYAASHELPRTLATRAWNGITHPWDRYNRAALLERQNKPLDSWDIDRLHRTPEWKKNLCIEEDVVSFRGLQHVVKHDLVSKLFLVGPKSEPIIRGVVEAFELKLTDENIS